EPGRGARLLAAQPERALVRGSARHVQSSLLAGKGAGSGGATLGEPARRGLFDGARRPMRVRRRLPPVMQERDYALLWVALLVMAFATQMTAVAVGWQVYAINRNPFDLGLIGLAEFLPLPLLALPAGHVADRFQRRRVFAVSLVIEIVVACLLLVVTVAGANQLWPFLVLAAATGVAGSLGAPAGRSIPPEVVSAELLPSAMALRSIGGQAAGIGGPANGGRVLCLVY